MWLIADEVMSGFGRCGEWFAWQRYGEAGRPDLMTLAKGLTGAHAAARRRRALARQSPRTLEHEMLYSRASPTAAIRCPAPPASPRSTPMRTRD